MNHDLIKKALQEKPLTAAESLMLDQALESDGCMAARGLVMNLESDEPNMAWRSELNSRLHTVSRRRQRNAWLSFAGIATPVAACAAALAIWVARPQEQPPAIPNHSVASKGQSAAVDNSGKEEILVSTHQEAMRVSALGVNMPEETSSSYDWSSIGYR